MHKAHSSIAPINALQSFKANMTRDIKKFRRKYLILRIKWFLLFVLPILLTVIAYQTIKQLLKIKIKQLGVKAEHEITPHEQSEKSTGKTL